MKLLFVDCCISQRGRESRTKALCDAFLRAFSAAHPDDEVEILKLRAMTLPPLTRILVDERDALTREKKFSAPVFAPAWQFVKADRIVVGAPFWDLSFPAQLRVYIEHISANGVAYHYDGTGCHGDCHAAKLCYLTTGGDLETPVSIGVEYWRQLCKMFGIPEFQYVFAGGLDLDPAKAPEILAQSCEKARAIAEKF